MTGKTITRKFKMESYDNYKKLISDFRVIDVRSGDIQDEYKRKSVGQVHYLINLKVREPYNEIYRILRPKEWGPQFTGDGYSRGKSPNKKELEDRLKEFFFRYLRKKKTPTGHSISQLLNNFSLLKENFLLSLEENDFNPYKNKKLEIKQKNGEFVEDKHIKQMIERVIKGRIDYIINNVLDVYYRERTLGDFLPSLKGYEEAKKKQDSYGMPGGKPITISDSKKLSDEEKDILRGWGVRFEEDEFNPFFNDDKDEPLHSSNPFSFKMNDLFSLGRGDDEEEGEEDDEEKRKYKPREGETPKEYSKRLRKLRKKKERNDRKRRKKMTKSRRKSRRSRKKFRMKSTKKEVDGIEIDHTIYTHKGFIKPQDRMYLIVKRIDENIYNPLIYDPTIPFRHKIRLQKEGGKSNYVIEILVVDENGNTDQLPERYPTLTSQFLNNFRVYKRLRSKKIP